MQFTKFFQLLTLAAAASADVASVAYDTTYDNKALSLSSVSCSDGPNGLLSKYATIGDIPTEYVGAVPAIGGWGSDKCGSCWAVSWKGTTVHVVGIDSSRGSGFNVAKAAMDEMTGGQAEFLGRVNDADAVEVDKSLCGL